MGRLGQISSEDVTPVFGRIQAEVWPGTIVMVKGFDRIILISLLETFLGCSRYHADWRRPLLELER